MPPPPPALPRRAEHWRAHRTHGMQIASAGLRKCRGVQRGEERGEGERGKGSGGIWRVRKEPCPSPGIAAVLGLPLLHPEGPGDFWAETATFWEATGGSTGHGARRAPSVGKLRQG